MINDNLAAPIHKIATKSFENMSDPDKITIQRLFVRYWDDFLEDTEVIKNGVRPVVLQEVERMMSCGTVDAGFEIYECPNCRKIHIICYTCKSRFCNSCGIKLAKIRAEFISNAVLDVSHRHVVFTIDERLRRFFKKDRLLLNALFETAKDTIFYTFNKMNGKKKTFTPGFILTLHTFGRDLKWNPHIHVLLTEGALDESRIVDFDYASRIIHYYYEDHTTEERVEVTEHVIEFMKKLVQHIPEPQFKMIRYCGLYATCDHTHNPRSRKDA